MLIQVMSKLLFAKTLRIICSRSSSLSYKISKMNVQNFTNRKFKKCLILTFLNNWYLMRCRTLPIESNILSAYLNNNNK